MDYSPVEDIRPFLLGLFVGATIFSHFSHISQIYLIFSLSFSSHLLSISLSFLAGQRPNGDVGTCCVVYNATTRQPLPLHEQGSSPNVGVMTKADATTDAEASLVSTLCLPGELDATH